MSGSTIFARILPIICCYSEADLDRFPPSRALSLRGSGDVLDRNKPLPTKPPGHWQLTLNDWLQDHHGTTENLTWETRSMGGFWEAIAFYEGVEYGRGTGITTNDAKEQAAHQVLIALRGDDYDNKSDQKKQPHAVLQRPNSGYLKIICCDSEADLDRSPPSPTPSLRGSGDILDRNKPPTKSSGHWQLMLKKWLKERYGTTENLTWKAAQMPDNWVVVAYYKKIEYGRGTGITRDDATEQAAQQVLIALRGDYDDDSDQKRPHAVLRRPSLNGTAADQAMQLPDILDSAPEPYKSHNKLTLGNWLQGRYGTSKHLTWDETHTGPADSGSWEVIAYINDIEFGRAKASTKHDATEEAAEEVLRVLRNY